MYGSFVALYRWVWSEVDMNVRVICGSVQVDVVRSGCECTGHVALYRWMLSEVDMNVRVICGSVQVDVVRSGCECRGHMWLCTGGCCQKWM